MHNKFNYHKHPAQWLMACAATAFMMGYANIVSANSNNSTALNNQTTETSTALASESSNSTEDSKITNNSNIKNNSDDKQSNNNTNLNNSNSTSTTANNSQIGGETNHELDMSKVHYTISMHIPLNPSLTYDVVYVPTSPNDLYFGNDQAQPIPAPVDVGTYKVWLSKTGYDNVVAGRNFWVSTNGSDFVFYPVWDVMPNINIGPYNPLNFGYGTYTITPYDIKAVITGKQTFNNSDSSTESLNPNNYQISFSGTDPKDESFDKVSKGFKYTFQDGDLMLVSTQTSGYYQVFLTDQGLSNIKQALTKAFHNNANNFSLQTDNITTQAIAQVIEQQRTITRTIILNCPDGQTKQYQQTATITRSYQLNDQHTGIVWGDWSTAQWPVLNVPKYQGYNASMDVIPSVVVDGNSTDQTIIISYHKISTPENNSSNDQNQQQPSNFSTTSSSSSVVKTSSSNNQTNQSLPQTGDEHYQASIGLGSAALLGILGLVGIRKRHQ